LDSALTMRGPEFFTQKELSHTKCLFNDCFVENNQKGVEINWK